MKVAIICSKNLICTNLSQLLPSETLEIVTGGARGIETCAANLAITGGLGLTIFLSEYEKYKSLSSLVKYLKIIN